MATAKIISTKKIIDYTNAKLHGDGWIGHCLNLDHPDRHPSMSISERNGRTLLYCHVCQCESSILVDTARELGLWSSGNNVRKSNKPKQFEEYLNFAKHEACYSYRDGSGKECFRTHRFRFSDGDKAVIPFTKNEKGDWIDRLNGHDPGLPYRLPEIISSKAEEPVFIVEGEKCANSVANLGLVGTTNRGGAGNWNKAHSKYLRGRQVILLPDNDPPGEKHIEKIYSTLKNYAESIKVLRLPGLKKKEDIADWLEKGGTKDEFLKLAENADDYVPETAGTTSEIGIKPCSPDDEIALHVINQFSSENIIYSQNSFWVWHESGIWIKEHDRAVKKAIHQTARELREILPEGGLKRSFADSVCDLIKTEAFCGSKFNTNSTGINCMNGELHFDSQNWHLKPHKRESYRTTQIPVIYDPQAKAPRFEQFLREIFDGDPDWAEKTTVLLELIGYTLTTSCEYERFALLLGAGANGKS